MHRRPSSSTARRHSASTSQELRSSVMIVFNAEGGVGWADGIRLYLYIMLDPAGGTATFSPIAPTGAAFLTPLCSGDGSASNTDSLIMGTVAVGATCLRASTGFK